MLFCFEPMLHNSPSGHSRCEMAEMGAEYVCTTFAANQKVILGMEIVSGHFFTVSGM